MKAHSSRIPLALEKFIQWGLLVIVAVMPFHASLTVWAGTTIGHRAIFQGWKEAVLVILGLATVALLMTDRTRWRRLNRPVVWAIGALTALGLIVTLFAWPGAKAVIFGLKTDYEYLAAFLIALVVADRSWLRRVVVTILAGGAVVVGFGLLQAFVLPPSFLTQFGYGPDTVVPYLILDAETGALRFGSSLGGPNQLGTYLIVIISLALAIGWRQRRWWLLGLVPLATIVLINTHSRSAWIGAALAIIIITISHLPREQRRVTLLILLALGLTAVAVAPQITHHDNPLQPYLLHGGDTFDDQRGSDYEHLTSLTSGVQALIQQPFGHGLGTAGPAVFHTGAGRIIENYYLQIGYQAGILGLGLFLAILFWLAQHLWRQSNKSPVVAGLLAALAGISANAFFLPAWTDSTTALIFWIIAGASFAYQQDKTHV